MTAPSDLEIPPVRLPGQRELPSEDALADAASAQQARANAAEARMAELEAELASLRSR